MSLKEYVFMSLCLQLNYGIEEYVIMSKKGYVILSGRGTSLYP